MESLNLLQKLNDEMDSSFDTVDVLESALKVLISFTTADQAVVVISNTYFPIAWYPDPTPQYLQTLDYFREKLSQTNYHNSTFDTFLIEHVFYRMPIDDFDYTILLFTNQKHSPSDSEIEFCELIGKKLLISLNKNNEIGRNRILNVLLEQTAELFSAKRACIHRYDRNRNILVFMGGYKHNLSVSLKVGEGLAGHLIRITDDYIIHPNYNASLHGLKYYGGKRVFPSILKVKLKWLGEIIGVLSLDRELGHNFTEEEAQQLLEFGENRIVGEVVRSDILENLVKITEKSTDLARVVLNGDINSTLDKIVQDIRHITGCDSATLYYYDNRTDELVLRSVAGLHDEDMMNESLLDLPRNRIFRELEGGKEYIRNEIEGDAHAKTSEFILSNNIQSYAAFALDLHSVNNRKAILFVNYLYRHEFGHSELDAIRLFVNLANVAINHYEKEIDTNKNLRLLLEKNLDFLARKISHKVLFKEIVQRAAELLGAPRAGLREYDEDQGILFLVASWHRNTIVKHMPVGEGFAGRLVEANAPPYYIIDDYEKWIIDREPHLRRIQKGAVLAVPVRFAGKPIGVLFVNDDLGRKFDHTHAEVLISYAEQAALALQNYKLFERRKNVQNIFEKVAPAILSGSLETALKVIVKLTKDVMRCDAVVLYIIDPAVGLLANPAIHIGLKYPNQMIATGHVRKKSKIYKIFTRAKHIVRDVNIDGLFYRKKFIVNEDIKSYVAVPLVDGTTRVALIFAHYRYINRFDDLILEKFRLLAHQTALAIQFIRSREAEAQRADMLNELNASSSEITKTRMLEETFQMIVDSAAKITEKTGITDKAIGVIHQIIETSPETFYAPITKTYPTSKMDFVKPRLDNPNGITRTVIREKDKVIIKNIGIKDRRVNPALYPEGIRALIALPLTFDSKVLGVLFIYSMRPDNFARVEDFLIQMANHTTIAINNTNQYNQVQSLEQRQKDFLLFAAHQLRDTIFAIDSSLDMLNRPTLSLEYKDMWLKIIRKELESMRFVDFNFLDYYKIEFGNGVIDPIMKNLSLKNIVVESIEALSPLKETTVKIQVNISNDDLEVICDQHMITQIVKNIFHNAIKFTYQGKITVNLERVESKILVSIEDTGIGIDQTVREKIFDLHKTGASNRKGMGVGLYLAQTFAKSHGSRIFVDSKPGIGSKFYFLL